MTKVSILMPTYNDSKTILETLDSIMCQEYKDYEVLICDDGSKDNTKNVIEKYKKDNDPDDKIKYFYQENKDQLNAIITLLPNITGEYIYILHSDDLLYDNDTLSKMVNYMEENPMVDSIISDMVIINKDSKITGKQIVKDYNKTNQIIPLQLLWLGRNLYVDMAFHKKEVFVKEVKNNYLLWNGPFWLNLDTNDTLNVKKVDFPFFKYRVFEENYVHSEGANLNIINGEIRVVTRLLKNYDIPFYKLQYILYRIFNKLKLNKLYKVIYRNRESNNKYNIIKFVLNKRFTDTETENNMFLNALLNFYKNKNSRVVKLDKINENILYYGKDMRIFNKKITSNSIDVFYKKILNEMNIGFNEIIVDNKKEYKKAEILTKFLCIYPYIKIKIRSNKNGK